jgi:hypothetical protein
MYLFVWLAVELVVGFWLTLVIWMPGAALVWASETMICWTHGLTCGLSPALLVVKRLFSS